MKIVYRYCLFFFLVTPFCSVAQKDAADSIYFDFERCLSGYFKQEYKKIDSSYIFFYGNKFNVNMKLVANDLGSGKYYTNIHNEKLDSTQENDTTYRPFFYRGMGFDEFMNYMIDQKPSNGCILRKEKGAWVFVDCTMENWQHFYFDRLIYKDGFYVTPIVDILQSEGTGSIEHRRYVFICYYTLGKGFRLVKKHLVRKDKICN